MASSRTTITRNQRDATLFHLLFGEYARIVLLEPGVAAEDPDRNHVDVEQMRTQYSFKYSILSSPPGLLGDVMILRGSFFAVRPGTSMVPESRSRSTGSS